MTFEQTMLESHLEALQANYDRLKERNINLLYEVNTQKERNENLLEKNKMLKVENKMLKVENEKLNDMLDEQERSWL